MSRKATAFAVRLLAWYDHHGRRDLPWKSRDLYRVWVSEIMLQQTQVETVIPYYRRFLQRFPDVRTLARAPLDDVLAHWAGLGYYARAHNLHRAARVVMERHSGRFPGTFDSVLALPGIGRSTAGAILALARGKRQPILDGNVKRVLARYYAVTEPPARAEARLWRLADRNTPARRIADYTQAVMDLGATICRRKPDCPRCPVASGCAARRGRLTHAIPARVERRVRPRKAVQMVMLCSGGSVLLERRPPAGIWGGLWSLPECPAGRDAAQCFERRFGIAIETEPPWPPFDHRFTHFDLRITPVPARMLDCAPAVADADTVWYKLDRPGARGLAAPVQWLLQRLREFS